MREAKTTKLYNSITNVNDEIIEEAQTIKLKREHPVWLKWCALTACMCLAVGLGTQVLPQIPNGGGTKNGNNWWGSEDSDVGAVRREDFSPEFPSEAKIAFADVPGVLKTYRTLNNSWFLSEELTDFSQILTDEVRYVVPGSSGGAYAFYTLDENGKPQWGGSVSGGLSTIPYQFSGLTEEIIQEDLAGVDYEDYIIAQSNRLYTVFIWARCADGEDMFVTYPARPEFVGLENRGRYTLDEIQHILTEFCVESNP